MNSPSTLRSITALALMAGISSCSPAIKRGTAEVFAVCPLGSSLTPPPDKIKPDRGATETGNHSINADCVDRVTNEKRVTFSIVYQPGVDITLRTDEAAHDLADQKVAGLYFQCPAGSTHNHEKDKSDLDISMECTDPTGNIPISFGVLVRTPGFSQAEFQPGDNYRAGVKLTLRAGSKGLADLTPGK